MKQPRKCDALRLHRLVPRITALGPYMRLGIWTQGCLRRCPNCITPESQPLTGGRLAAFDEIEALFLRYPEQEGLTISGGEPFLQAGALCCLIDRLRAHRDAGVIVYTGYTLEELLRSEDAEENQALLERIDLLIDGPYRAELDDGKTLRGSANQRVIPLTNRYRNCLDLYGAAQPRKTELKYTEEGFGLVGIPPRQSKEESKT